MKLSLDYAIILIVIGVAADNLIISGLSSNRNEKITWRRWLLIIGFLVFGQYCAIVSGSYLGKLLFPEVNKYVQCFGVCLLTSMLVQIGRDMLRLSRQRTLIIAYTTKNILLILMSTCIYQLVLGIALCWLGLGAQRLVLFSTSVMFLFFLLGFILGKSHLTQSIKHIRSICIALMLAGICLLIKQIF